MNRADNLQPAFRIPDPVRNRVQELHDPAGHHDSNLVILVTAGVQRPAYLGVLWQRSAGFKMAVWASLLLTVGTAGYVAGCWCLNRATVLGGPRTLYRVLMAAIAVGYSVFFYLPAVFTVLIGPAAVQIQNSLRGG